MRILAIETATRQGSVALIDATRCVATAKHETENAHAEKVLPLVEQVLEEAGWRRKDIDRVVVGTGPGSFTGLRVGIALGQGIATSLGIPIVGVGSLRSMARAVPASVSEVRCPVIDARRGEAFVAAFAADQSPLLDPCSVPVADVVPYLSDHLDRDWLLVGRFAQQIAPDSAIHCDDYSALPHARWAGLLGANLDPSADVVPLYVRAPDAKLPELPPSPIER